MIKDGRLTIPLYHGTSTLFQDSIFKHGLGGRNVIEELGIRRAAGLLVELCGEHELEEGWMLEIDACKRIAQDPATQKLRDDHSFSFRYGGAYVSPSRASAATYARYYGAQGSEALAYTSRLLEKALSIFPRLERRIEFQALWELGKIPKEPMLISLRNVAVSALRREQGGDPGKVLREIEDCLSKSRDVFEFLVAQSNFELVAPVPANQLRVLKMSRKELGLTRSR